MNDILVATLSTAFVCIGGGTFVIFLYRRKMRDNMERLLNALDRAICGEIGEEIYDESMDSAIAERLNRIIQITGMQKERAETERDYVKSLISDISHQVRTPLSSIVLYSGLLKELKMNQEAGKLADKIIANCDKLDFFLRELVKSSYTERELIKIHPEQVEISELVDIACQNIEVMAMKKEIEIHRKVAGRTDKVKGFADKKWTIEAIFNILENAVKYSARQSAVEVEIVQYEAFVCIQVTDHGIGIAEEEQGKVFERFYRGSQVKQEDGFGIFAML